MTILLHQKKQIDELYEKLEEQRRWISHVEQMQEEEDKDVDKGEDEGHGGLMQEKIALVDERDPLFTSKCRLRDLAKHERFIVVNKAKHSTRWIKKLGIAHLFFDKMVHPLSWADYQEEKQNIVLSPFNYGAEASGYLQFIVEYCDCLPVR